LARVLDPPLLALEGAEHFPLPAFSYRLDRARREVRPRSVLEAGAEKGVDVGVRRAMLSAVLMNGKATLYSAGRAVKGLVHGVPQDALGQACVEACEPVCGLRVNREDEAEVDRVP